MSFGLTGGSGITAPTYYPNPKDVYRYGSADKVCWLGSSYYLAGDEIATSANYGHPSCSRILFENKYWYSAYCFNPQIPIDREHGACYPPEDVAPDTPPDSPPDTPPIPPSIPDGLPQDCCDKIDSGLEAIAEAIRNLKLEANVTVDACCDTVDKCASGVFDEAGKCVIEAAMSCEECCEALRNGIILSVDDASTCASCACDDIEKECSMAGLQPGERCEKCGEEPCCCQDDYTCGPCDPDKPAKKFVGYCNSVTGQVVVLREGTMPPQPTYQWQQAAISESESTALQQTQAYCVRQPTKGPRTPTPQEPSVHAVNICSYDVLRSGNSFESYLQSTGGAIKDAYFIDLSKSIADELLAQAGDIPIIGPLVAGLKNATTGPMMMAQQLGGLVSAIAGCDSPSWKFGLNALAATGLYSKYTGVDVAQFTQELTYGMNSECRRKHLSPADSIAAWLANAIDDQLLDRHWAIAGFCPDAVKSAMQSSKSKPVPLELIQMRFRGLIDAAGYENGMRQLGYKDSKVIRDLYERQKPLPTMSDIIRFMVRDADDEQLVKQFGLDANFQDKYQLQLKEWSASQGIDEKIAQYAWRSHWSIPSPGQLFTFWHRLRYNDKFGGKAKLEADIKAALIQQDILPYWHEHYLAVSFRPLSRVDVRRAYNIGAIDAAEVTKAYLDQGYSDDNAERLTKFATRLRDESAAGSKAIKLWLKFAIDGAETKRRMTVGGLPESVVDKAMADAEIGFKTSYPSIAFRNGEIPRDSFISGMTQHGMTQLGAIRLADQLGYAIKSVPPILDYEAGTETSANAITRAVYHGMALDRAEQMVRMIDSKINRKGALACQSALHGRFLIGELDREQTESALIGHGITAERATQLLKWWDCEKKAYGKAIPTNQLCEQFGRGAINGNDFVGRLAQLGYDEPTRMNLLTDCQLRLNLRASQQVKKQAEEQAKQNAKQRANSEKAAKQLERESKELERRRNAAVATRERRQKQAESAADKIIKKCGCSVSEAMQFVTDTKTRLPREYGLSIDETLQALLLATEAWDGISFDFLSEILNANSQIAVNTTLAATESGANVSSRINGST